MGLETRLRGRLHRQGQRQRRTRIVDEHGDAHRRHVVQRNRCRQDQRVHGEPRRNRSRHIEHAIPESLRVQARALAAESGEKLGHEYAAGDPVRLLGAQHTYGPLNGTTHKTRYNRGDVTTIAASVSNGGGASLAAAEQDTLGWITAVVVGEPQINLRVPSQVSVSQGGVPVASFGRPLADYMTLANLLQRCAALAPAAAGAPYLTALPVATTGAIRAARCASLAASGTIAGGDVISQATDALAKLHQAGYQTDSDLLQAPMWDSQAVPAVAVTYANAYTQSSVGDIFCSVCFGTINAVV